MGGQGERPSSFLEPLKSLVGLVGLVVSVINSVAVKTPLMSLQNIMQQNIVDCYYSIV